jgi:hypothetical protein
VTTPISEYAEATTWLYGKLTSPPITGILDAFEDAAPEGTTAATDIWIVFEAQADGLDAAEVGEQRIWTEFPFLVRAVTRGRSTVALKTYDKAIDARLHRKDGTTSEARVLSAVRTGPHQDHWLEQGVEFRALGGFYNVIVQSLDP